MIKSLYALMFFIFQSTPDKRICGYCGRNSIESIDVIDEKDCSYCEDYLKSKISSKK
jgi:hypothetical protein